MNGNFIADNTHNCLIISYKNPFFFVNMVRAYKPYRQTRPNTGAHKKHISRKKKRHLQNLQEIHKAKRRKSNVLQQTVCKHHKKKRSGVCKICNDSKNGPKDFERPAVCCKKCQCNIHVNDTITLAFFMDLEPFTTREKPFQIDHNFLCCFCCDTFQPITNKSIKPWTHVKTELRGTRIRVCLENRTVGYHNPKRRKHYFVHRDRNKYHDPELVPSERRIKLKYDNFLKLSIKHFKKEYDGTADLPSDEEWLSLLKRNFTKENNYKLKNNKITAGGIVLDNMLLPIELKLYEDVYMSYFSFFEGDNNHPLCKLYQQHPEMFDPWTDKDGLIIFRLKIFTGFGYIKYKDAKTKDIIKSRISKFRLKWTRFLLFRISAYFGFDLTKYINSTQMNLYKAKHGIAVHQDEGIWFGGPIILFRFGHKVTLSFGVKQNNVYFNENLDIEIERGSFFIMYGFLKHLFKHTVRGAERNVPEDAGAMVMRFTDIIGRNNNNVNMKMSDSDFNLMIELLCACELN